MVTIPRDTLLKHIVVAQNNIDELKFARLRTALESEVSKRNNSLWRIGLNRLRVWVGLRPLSLVTTEQIQNEWRKWRGHYNDLPKLMSFTAPLEDESTISRVLKHCVASQSDKVEVSDQDWKLLSKYLKGVPNG